MPGAAEPGAASAVARTAQYWRELYTSTSTGSQRDTARAQDKAEPQPEQVLENDQPRPKTLEDLEAEAYHDLARSKKAKAGGATATKAAAKAKEKAKAKPAPTADAKTKTAAKAKAKSAAKPKAKTQPSKKAVAKSHLKPSPQTKGKIFGCPRCRGNEKGCSLCLQPGYKGIRCPGREAWKKYHAAMLAAKAKAKAKK